MWGDFSIDDLLDYSFEDVFRDEEQEAKGTRRAIKFSDYISSLFSALNEKLAEIPAARKERLVVTEFVNMGLQDPEGTGPAERKGKGGTADADTNTEQGRPRDNVAQTGEELLPVVIREVEVPSGKPTKHQFFQTKATNQLILDKAMEEEFTKTMETMDHFVEKLCHNEFPTRKVKELALHGVAEPEDGLSAQRRQEPNADIAGSDGGAVGLPRPTGLTLDDIIGPEMNEMNRILDSGRK